MTLLEKIRLIGEIVAWRLRWGRRDLDYHPGPDCSDKIITARQAAALIPDGVTAISSGMAGNSRCSAFFWAIRERFESEGHPRDLTWISVGGQGGRGKAPGSVEEVGVEGLVTRYISGHVETVKSMLALARDGKMDIHVLPQGEMTEIIEAQSRGERVVRSPTGLDCFLDPRCGPGTAVVSRDGSNFVEVDGDLLAYEMPPIDVALFNAGYADRKGNVYLTDIATLTETPESIAAAHANGGLAMGTVEDVRPRRGRRRSQGGGEAAAHQQIPPHHAGTWTRRGGPRSLGRAAVLRGRAEGCAYQHRCRVSGRGMPRGL
jgi:propionate CoA-transferase